MILGVSNLHLIVITAILYLLVTGHFIDYMKRTKIKLASRLQIFLTPLAYWSIVILTIFLIIDYYLGRFDLSLEAVLNMASSIIYTPKYSFDTLIIISFIPLILMISIVVLGSIPIEAINRFGFDTSFKLSLRLFFSILIDIFWGFIAFLLVQIISFITLSIYLVGAAGLDFVNALFIFVTLPLALAVWRWGPSRIIGSLLIIVGIIIIIYGFVTAQAVALERASRLILLFFFLVGLGIAGMGYEIYFKGIDRVIGSSLIILGIGLLIIFALIYYFLQQYLYGALIGILQLFFPPSIMILVAGVAVYFWGDP